MIAGTMAVTACPYCYRDGETVNVSWRKGDKTYVVCPTHGVMSMKEFWRQWNGPDCPIAKIIESKSSQ